MSDTASEIVAVCDRPRSERAPPGWLDESPDVALGFIVRDQACHSIHANAANPKAWVHRVSVTNGYIAVLGMLVREHAAREGVILPVGFVSSRATCKGHVKRAPLFGAWGLRSLTKLCNELQEMGLTGLNELDEAYLQAFYDEHASGIIRRILAMDAISACLRPVAETLIVADRVAFLLERGHTASPKAMFDPKLSARNFVITATKASDGPR